MEATPELEQRTASTPIVVPQLGERLAENYFHVPFDQAPGLEALSTAATGNFHYIRPLSASAQSPGDANVSPHSSNNLNFILNPAGPDGALSMCPISLRNFADSSPSDMASPPIDHNLMTSRQAFSANDPRPVGDHEVAFLLRHFGETAGQW